MAGMIWQLYGSVGISKRAQYAGKWSFGQYMFVVLAVTNSTRTFLLLSQIITVKSENLKMINKNKKLIYWS